MFHTPYSGWGGEERKKAVGKKSHDPDLIIFGGLGGGLFVTNDSDQHCPELLHTLGLNLSHSCTSRDQVRSGEEL